MKKLSRRKFLKFLGLAGAGAVASQLPTPEIKPIPDNPREPMAWEVASAQEHKFVNHPTCIYVGEDGTIYIGGEFTDWSKK